MLHSSHPRAIRNLIHAAFLGAMFLPLSSCGNQAAQPQVFTMNYFVVQVPDADAFIAEIAAGQTKIGDLLARTQCTFAQDFTPQPGGSLPDLDVIGAPGDRGFFVNVQIPTAVAMSTEAANPQGCASPREILIEIGSRTGTLGLREHTNASNGRLVLQDGREFARSQYFDAAIDGYDSSSKRTSGEFSFADKADGQHVLIAQGSFAMNG